MTPITMEECMPRLRIAADPGNPAQTVLCVLLGAGFTLALFVGMAHFSGVKQTAPQAGIEDIRAVALPFEPPPPPRVTPADPEPVAEVTTVTGFEFSPSDSPVKIAVSPPNLNDLAATYQVAPPAIIQIGQFYGEFKPKMAMSIDVQHIYQKTEVDNPPTILFRAAPSIPQRLFGETTIMRMRLLFVVETDGAITHVRIAQSSGIPEADAIVTETVQHDWGFAPATKKGRKVRCLLEQPFRIELPRHSKFQE
jgi:TonB family protein